MLQNYIGKMTVSNVLANITLLAEVIDAMLVSKLSLPQKV